MTVARSPNSKASVEQKKNTMVSSSGEVSEMTPANPSSQSQKRNHNLLVRVIQNGTTCHQCRHRINGVYANCNNQAKTKPCIIKYCRTCLLNRYGEKVEDVVLLEKWDCPRCKGVCNCSICMKKRGHQPTGMVTKTAKAGKFSSVLDMIVTKGAQNVGNYKRVKDTTASPRKRINDISLPNNMKRKGFEVKLDRSGINDVSATETNVLDENHQKKLKSTVSKEIVGGDATNGLISKVNCSQQPENEVKEKIILNQNATRQIEDNQCLKVKKNGLNSFEAVINLPTGIELVNIAGVELPKEDAGNALQFLEFIATFGKILDVKKEQAEAVLRDLIKGRSTRRGKYTSVIQFHIQLLSAIKEESESESESETVSSTHGNDSWLKVLKSCISRSKLYIDIVDMTAGGYDKLDSSMKLKLLVFLCDEVLGTEKVRKYIDDQNTEHYEKRKEARDKLSVAKDKEKSLKQKMQDEIAKAIIAKEGVPLTIKEHDAIVSKIKGQAAEAHAELLACKTMVPTGVERPDAVRTEPIFSDNNGHVFWRLKGCSEKPGLLQDMGTGDHTSVDKWFEYDDEQTGLIEKSVNVFRSRYRKY